MIRPSIAIAACAIAGLLQTGPADADRLADVVEAAVAAHPAVQAAEADLQAAQDDADAQFGAFLPQVRGEADYGYQSANNTSTRGRARGGEGFGGDVDTVRSTASLTITQQIFDGFRNQADLTSLRRTADSRMFDLNEAMEEISLRVATAYLAVMRAHELIALADRNVERHLATLDAVQVQFDQGIVAEADVFQAQSRLALARTTQRQRLTQLADAEAAYIEATGGPPAGLQTVVLGPIDLPKGIDSAVVEATRASWQLKSAAAARQASIADIDSARADYFPSIDLELSASAEKDTNGTFGTDKDGTALVVMSYDLFTGGRDSAEHDAAIARMRASNSREAETRRQIEEQVRVAFNGYREAVDTLSLLEARMEAADRVVTAYSRQFQLGQRTLLDLLDVENELFQARSGFVDGDYELTLATFELLRALSRLTPEIATLDGGVSLDDAMQRRSWAGEEADEFVRPSPQAAPLPEDDLFGTEEGGVGETLDPGALQENDQSMQTPPAAAVATAAPEIQAPAPAFTDGETGLSVAEEAAVGEIAPASGGSASLFDPNRLPPDGIFDAAQPLADPTASSTARPLSEVLGQN